tara:strand:+ start:751 stop:1026 length:276 start_codon:yes stop_codon:yes gene_type:complete
MKKISLSVAALTIAMMSYGQSTQCKGLTKDSVQCKNTTKSYNSLCHYHNPYYVKPSKTVAVVCTGTTKSGKNCKNKTKNSNQLCHLHNKKD